MNFTYVRYRWVSPRRVWAFAMAPRLRFGRCHTLFTHTWSLGPFTLAFTDLDRTRGDR